ncbi:tryptophan synthase subunit alpha [Phycicoccus sp. MAQZ13P-2]|uniref:tryptophan synthase subunit alpha n=1 Tax=Phycicoccus mangrovi TaxID=2840470 RepID=UPI001C004FD9|nr:tryptophan synthase subunit alpha [Phycicoccus mangrovi]MBT9257046.1 tryptophan synthase subunit alpha [Phycicoccus mangrovi]MBT9275464.1 tryptophan synthase subunit alpha [Phycicoccus mangrovi]
MSTTQATRLGEVLERCRAEGRAALVGYLPVGYPSVEDSIEAMKVLVEAGCDIVEVGVAYSDPVIDGPVNQEAMAAALAAGVRVDDVFTAVSAVRDAGAVPVVMTYWNLVLKRGVETFAADLEAAGGAGLITPDLVPDEADDWLAASERHGLDRVFLVAPSSTPDRLEKVTSACRGFVYAASTMGVTGVRTSVDTDARTLVERVREVTDVPVCIGLGVSTREQAAEIAAYADGVIVGSALVRTLAGDGELSDRLEALRSLTTELAQGVREGKR